MDIQRWINEPAPPIYTKNQAITIIIYITGLMFGFTDLTWYIRYTFFNTPPSLYSLLAGILVSVTAYALFGKHLKE